jgi:hypothetical protein
MAPATAATAATWYIECTVGKLQWSVGGGCLTDRIKSKCRITTVTPPPGLPCENNGMARPRRCPLIVLQGTLAGQPASLLVDCGATDNFINEDFIRKHSISTSQYPQGSQAVRLGDGTLCQASSYASSVPTKIKNWSADLHYEILPLGQYDAILGMPWLHAFVPVLCWKTYRLLAIRESHNGDFIQLCEDDAAKELVEATSRYLNGQPTGVSEARVTETKEEEMLLVKKLSENASDLTKGSAQAAGFDIRSAEDTIVPARGRKTVV